MNADLAERVLEEARRRADAAEVIYEESEDHSVEFENNVLKGVSADTARGVGLRVIHRGRIGFSSTTDPEALGRLVDNALASAAFGQEARFEFPATCRMPQVAVYDPDVAEFTAKQGIAMVRAAIDYLRTQMPDLHCGGGVSWSLTRRRLLNSRGLDVELQTSSFEMGIEALRVDEDGFLEVGEGRGWRRPTDDLMPQTRRVAEKIRLAGRTAPPVAGQLPVIFAPKAVGVLLASLAMNTNGKYVQKGVSILKDRRGEKIVDERITLWDDSLVDYAPGSLPVDGEGVACRRLPVIEKGVLCNFCFDLQTAGLLGCESTGSATRSFSTMPAPSHANLRMEPGESSLARMIPEMKRGIVVDQVLGAGQSNVLAGEFSLNLDLGYLIENGEIVGRLKNTMISGNVFDVLNDLVAIGQPAEWHGSEEVPALWLRGVSVSAGG